MESEAADKVDDRVSRSGGFAGRVESTLIDAHNHLQQLDDPDAAIAEMKQVGIRGCVVNGTSEADWPQVAELARAHPEFVHPAFGLHPWFAHQRSGEWLEKLTSYLDAFPHASIGECGVDRWTDEPSLKMQREAFLPQIKLARERKLPLTVHALKAWGPLMEALDEEEPPERGFLLHSYGGSPELVEQLLPYGAHFSASGYFLQPRKAKSIEAFRAVSPDRLLLETDAPNMEPPEFYMTHSLKNGGNHPANLAAVARGFAQHFNESEEELMTRCAENTRAFFNLT